MKLNKKGLHLGIKIIFQKKQMAVQEFQDYVFVPKVTMMIDFGVFVGTQDYLFCFPSRTETHEYRKIITTDYSFKGKAMDEAISDILKLASTKRELEEQLVSMASEVSEMEWFKIEDLGGFKVEAHFFGSGIHTNDTDRKVGFKPFVQSLGKEKKKQIKEFYARHPKSR